MQTSRALVAGRTRMPPELTAGDRAALAKYGRKGLFRRLRVQVTAAWGAVASTIVVGFPMMMSESYDVSDAGILVTMMSVPAMVVAAHGQSRITRLNASDPSRPIVRPARAADPDSPELEQLAQVRTQLIDLVVAIQDVYPDVAAAMRSADERAHLALAQQARALATLGESDDPSIAEARQEIHDRLQAGLSEYRHMLAQAALLLARTDAHMNVDAPLRSAADLAATYSEGIKVSEDSGR